jgi:hypothetical protein
MGRIYAAVSDEENIALCREFGVTFVEGPNNPVSFKWQAALDLVPKGERVMVLGSDDFISREWWDVAGASTADLVVPASLSFWEPSTGRACILNSNPQGAQAFGAGRVLSPRLLAAVSPMWEFAGDAGLDTMAMTACRASGFEPTVVATERVPVCDVKSDANIWRYGQGWWMRSAVACSPEDAAWMLDRKSLTACS